ncbi:N-acetylated-alpha-linked acidic dipeptidase 2 [Aphelenchoides avenae]|nr:N-acetylated-alpha-linked acidic dipeptidase 2 [Aphelenchus avenae]
MEGAPLYTYMLYHSMFEIPWVNEQFIDPTGAVFTAVGQLWLELARNLAESLIIPFNVEDYASQLEDFRWRMDAQLVHLGIDKALGHEYSKKMTALDVALQEFRAAAVEVQNIVQAVNNGERALSVRQAEMINSRMTAVERCFILDAGLYPERSFFRHAVFSASEHDVYSGVTFALIVDPAVEWSLASNATSRRHWLETVLMGFTRLQYTIESAVHMLRLDGFDDNGDVQRS